MEPTGHDVHKEAPSEENVPAVQSLHSILPSFELNVPAVQFSATLLLSVGTNLPEGAKRQSLNELAPSKG